MKKLTLAFFTLIYCLTATNLKAQPFTGSLLWEISGNGLEEPSYIFGTHHLIDSSFLDSVPQLWNSFNKCDQIVGEIDMNGLATLPAILQTQMLLHEDETYLNFLSQEEYATLDTLLINNMGAGLGQAFGRYKPSIISLTLTQLMATEIMKLNMQTHKPIDIILQERAIEENKQVSGLETAESQLDIILNGTTHREQALSITCLLQHKKETLDELIALNESYKKGDLSILENWETSSICATSEEYGKVLNDNRNNSWIEKLPSLFTDKPTFVAVGSLHLAGDVGLLSLLHNLGYTIKAVK